MVAKAFHYVVALGSNRRHAQHGPPALVLKAAICSLEGLGHNILAVAPIINTSPIGPSSRRYANSAVLISTDVAPEQLLVQTQYLERLFGRRIGQRWSQRTLDIDIILWSEGPFSSPTLIIPHPLFRIRDFVLKPLLRIVPQWRDPVSCYTIRQLLAQLQKKNAKVVDRRVKPD